MYIYICIYIYTYVYCGQSNSEYHLTIQLTTVKNGLLITFENSYPIKVDHIRSKYHTRGAPVGIVKLELLS